MRTLFFIFVLLLTYQSLAFAHPCEGLVNDNELFAFFERGANAQLQSFEQARRLGVYKPVVYKRTSTCRAPATDAMIHHYLLSKAGRNQLTAAIENKAARKKQKDAEFAKKAAEADRAMRAKWKREGDKICEEQPYLRSCKKERKKREADKKAVNVFQKEHDEAWCEDHPNTFDCRNKRN